MKNDRRIRIRTEEKSLLEIHNSIVDLLRSQSSVTGNINEVINYYNNIILCMPGNVYWLDRSCRTVGCNQNVLDMFGLDSIEDFYGLTFEEMAVIGGWTKGQAESFERDTLEVIETGLLKPSVEEPPIPGSDGEFIYFLTTRVPLFNTQGDVIGVVGISTDITDRKNMEKQLEKAMIQAKAASQAKSEFIANMSHDIRTPITGILGMAEILKSRANNDVDRHDIHLMTSATEELLTLLNEILELTEIESGRIKDELVVFRLSDLLQHNIALLEPAAQHKQLKINFSIDYNVPDILKGNKTLFDRIVLNLLSNAIKFTESGEVSIKVRHLKTEGKVTPKSVTLELLFIDTGIGISSDKLDVIFENFSRLSPAYEGMYKGSGLGLYTVKQYLKALNGTVHVDSKIGEGSCFTIQLPFQRASLDDLPSTPTIVSKASSSTVAPQLLREDIDTPIYPMANILLVEDHPLASEVAIYLLRKLGCKVDHARTGAQAIQKTQDRLYDLICLDIGLPDMSGLELTKIIRQSRGTAKSCVPIVALTAHMGDKQRQACLNAGIQEFLTKPLKPETAQLIIERYALNKKVVVKEEPSSKRAKKLPLIDLDVGASIVAGNKELAKQMLQMLVESLPDDMQALNTAYEAKDLPALTQALHRLHGSLSYTGTPKLKNTVEKLHSASRKNNLKELDRLYSILRDDVEQFFSEMETFVI